MQVPAEPPQEVRDESPRQRLRSLPPVPRSCLDDDLTLLDAFAPYVSVPVRLMYCLLYVGTIARVPDDTTGSSSSVSKVETRTREGDSVFVVVVPPEDSQRPLATVALVILLVVVAILIGYVIGRQRSLRE